jgi:uncharacterized membrane protein YfbV (UPF0208 family)
MTTFNITNIAPNLQKMKMTVFYTLSNGQSFSKTVPANTTVQEIFAIAQEKCTWFDENEQKIKDTIEEVRQTEIQREAIEQEIREEILTRLQ